MGLLGVDCVNVNGYHRSGALADKLLHQGTAYTAASTGDDNNLVFYVHCFPFLFL
jgi:hypothetical protein